MRKVAVAVDAAMKMHLLLARLLLISDMVSTPEQDTSAYNSEYAMQKEISTNVIMKSWKHGIMTDSTSQLCIHCRKTAFLFLGHSSSLRDRFEKAKT